MGQPERQGQPLELRGRDDPHRPRRVAILSLLFSWPSTGGGIVHTKELAEQLHSTGYHVRHILGAFAPWRTGTNGDSIRTEIDRLEFSEHDFTATTIRERFRSAVNAFDPDVVIVTDSWNTKPLLAEASIGYRYFLRLAALECICPLNNVRLLPGSDGRVRQCTANQLQDGGRCARCVRCNEASSGRLHVAERAIGGFHDDNYRTRLLRSFAEAEGVLAVNPQVAQLVTPYCRAVHTIPSGFDVDRFPADPVPPRRDRVGLTRVLFAGLVEEYMKGFHVLYEAGEILWRTRRDFQIVVTSEPCSVTAPFTSYIGWQSQCELPRVIHDSDLLVFPTVAQEALGRCAVEAMGCGRPVVASRIGGLPYVVQDGVTGLLVPPDDPITLARGIATLLDDPDLRIRMGRAGRNVFLQRFTWSVMIKRYRALLGPTVLPNVPWGFEALES